MSGGPAPSVCVLRDASFLWLATIQWFTCNRTQLSERARSDMNFSISIDEKSEFEDMDERRLWSNRIGRREIRIGRRERFRFVGIERRPVVAPRIPGFDVSGPVFLLFHCVVNDSYVLYLHRFVKCVAGRRQAALYRLGIGRQVFLRYPAGGSSQNCFRPSSVAVVCANLVRNTRRRKPFLVKVLFFIHTCP